MTNSIFYMFFTIWVSFNEGRPFLDLCVEVPIVLVYVLVFSTDDVV